MNLASTIGLQATALFAGVRIEGFTRPEEEYVRAGVSRIPPELLKNISKIQADRGMGAKHGNFDTETKIIRINPENFKLRVRLGRGAGWIYHAESTMAHEIGHSVFDSLPESRKQEWYDISGWVKSGNDGNSQGLAERYVEKRPGWPAYTSEWRHKKGVRFTRHYAEKSPEEDFADSFAFYCLGKPHQMSPKKRDFIGKVIGAKVQRYPKALVEGPTRAYGEKGN